MTVKIARIKKNMKQVDLRKQLHISSNKMVEIEKGIYDNVTIPLARQISEILEVPFEDLFLKECE